MSTWDETNGQRLQTRNKYQQQTVNGTIKLAGEKYNFKNVKVEGFVPMRSSQKINKNKIAIHGSLAGKVKIAFATLALIGAVVAGAMGFAASQSTSPIDTNTPPEPVAVQTNNQGEMITLRTTDGNYVKVPKEDYEEANRIYAEQNPEPTIPSSAPENNYSPAEEGIYPSFVQHR